MTRQRKVCFSPKLITMMSVLAFVLAGCAGYDYRNIPPKHEVRNAPIPVPWPKVKPSSSRKAVVSPAPRRSPAPQTFRTHTVVRGETVYGIARANGLEVRNMIMVNRLRAPYTLTVGQKLRVPAGAARVHVVRKGDTSYSISRRYAVDLSSLTRLNGLRPPYNLAIGQELRLPAGAGAGNSVNSGGLPRGAAVPPPPPRQGSKFLWPVKGRILSGFGPKPGGQHNDGINIRTTRGAEVRAADAGVVAYAGDELSGYGNLLLIRHAGGWVTAYAHNDGLLVKRGDKVSRGQVIARAGATGGVSEAQLHFEVRRGRAAVDPLRYLAGRRG